MILLIILSLVTYFVYRWITDNQDYFKVRGISEGDRNYGFGSMVKIFMKKASAHELILDIYNKYPNDQIVGLWEMNRPFIFVRDPKIMKMIAVKSFDHFHDKVPILSEDMDPFLVNSLVMLKGQKWRDMRTTLSPAFTGSKMRLMCELIVQIGDQVIEFMKKEAKEKGPQTYETRQFLSRIATDIIASCAFGIKVDSLHDSENTFYTKATALTNFTDIKKLLKFLAFRAVPKLVTAFRVKLNKQEDMDFFSRLVTDAMKVREEQNIIRPDMIHLLMEAQKGKLTHSQNDSDSAGFATVDEASIGWQKTTKTWSEIEIVAQCFVFLLAGYETITSVFGIVLYELTINHEIQQKLYEEIRDTQSKLNGKSHNYETLQKMKYLDMVISETLRKWPPAPFMDRVCNEEFTVELDDGKEFKFEKGNLLWIPIFGYHRDPKHFPDPDKFDPERFNEENKPSVDYYIPFGKGPRNCIGSRFALMELKSMLYHMLLNFSLEVTDKTPIPLVLAKTSSGIQAEGGIHIQFKPRN